MSENYEQLKLENQICFPLYAASREVIKQYHPFLDQIGLTYTQYIAMMVLWEEKTISVKELGRKLFLDSGTLTPLLKTLEKKGFLTRQRSREDERILLVSLTGKGEAFKKEAAEIPFKVGQCIKLSKEDAANLYRILYTILSHPDMTAT